MPLSTQVDLRQSQIVLDGDQLPQKGGHNSPPPNFRPAYATWYGGRPWFWPHSVRWGPRTSPKRRRSTPPILAHVLWPNSRMDQDTTWHGGMPRPKPHCVIWGYASAQATLCYLGTQLTLKGGTAAPQFSAHVCCDQ